MCFLSSAEYMSIARTIWRIFDWHLTRLALSLAFFRVGRRIAIRRAIIPITTSSSTSVNPRLRRISGVPFVPAQSSQEKSEVETEIYQKLSGHTIENPINRAEQSYQLFMLLSRYCYKTAGTTMFLVVPSEGWGNH